MDQVLHIQQQQNQEKIPPSLTNWFVLLRSQEWERKWNSNVFHSTKTVFVSSELHNPKKIVLRRAICNVLSSDYREELLAILWITESYSLFICQCIGNMTNMNGRPKKYKRNDLPTRGIGNWDDMKNRTKKADTIIALKTKQKKTQSWATTSVKTALGFREVQETEELSSPRAQQATALNNRQSPTVELGFRFSETSPKNGINRCARYPLLSSWFPYMMVPKVFLPPPKK